MCFDPCLKFILGEIIKVHKGESNTLINIQV